eukprot:SM000013S26570  [mRNA]  locus=s13:1142326:1144859:- [translate_table: standard]
MLWGARAAVGAVPGGIHGGQRPHHAPGLRRRVPYLAVLPPASTPPGERLCSCGGQASSTRRVLRDVAACHAAPPEMPEPPTLPMELAGAAAQVGLLSEALGCKPVVVAGSAAGLATVALTLGAPAGASRAWLQAGQVTVAFAFASHAAFAALVFGCVQRSQYRLGAHGSKAAALAGICLSALAGQLLRQQLGLDLLFLLSLLGQLAALGVALSLAASASDIDAADVASNTDEPGGPGAATSTASRLSGLLKTWAADMAAAVRVTGVGGWTWWALGSGAVHRSSLTYWQALVKVVAQQDVSREVNGYFSAAMYALAAAFTGTSASAPLEHHRMALQMGSPRPLGGLFLPPTPQSSVTRHAVLLGPWGYGYAAGSAAYIGRSLAREFDSNFIEGLCVHEVTAVACSAQVAMEVKLADVMASSHALHRSHISRHVTIVTAHPAASLPAPAAEGRSQARGGPLACPRERMTSTLTGARMSFAPGSPPERRLAALFASTAALSVLLEVTLQAALRHSATSLPQRFEAMAAALLVLSGTLALPPIGAAVMRAQWWSPEAAGSGDAVPLHYPGLHKARGHLMRTLDPLATADSSRPLLR